MLSKLGSKSNIIPLKPILCDRSGEEVDERCGMEYWWNRLEGGKGITPTIQETYFVSGSQLHEDMEMFAKGMTTEEVVAAIGPYIGEPDQIAQELHQRRLGWAAAWGTYQEPLLRKDFDEVSCEAETILDRDPLWVAVTPDRIQRRKGGGGLVYREWKSTATTRKEWQDHWTYAIQLHLGMAATAEELKEPFEYGQVTGFNKGQDRGGRLSHPYVWAYHQNGVWSHTYRPGWEHRPVWEFEGGVLDWVRRCGAEVASQQFIHSAPVMLDMRRVEEWVRVRTYRHMEIENVKGACQSDVGLRQLHFKPSSIFCRPAYGPPCAYLQACYNYSTRTDPVGSGAYKVREPHHDLERISDL